MCFSIGDFAYVLYVHPGRVSNLTFYVRSKIGDIFFHSQIGNLDVFAKGN